MYNSFSDSELLERYNKYSSIAAGRDTVTLEELARKSAVPYNTVLRDLQRILQHGWFGDGAYINYLSKTLVIRVPEAQNERYASDTPASGSSTVNGTYHFSYKSDTTSAADNLGSAFSDFASAMNDAASAVGNAASNVFSSVKKNSTSNSKFYKQNNGYRSDASSTSLALPPVSDLNKRLGRFFLIGGIICAFASFGYLGDAIDAISWGGFSYVIEEFVKALTWGGISVAGILGNISIKKRNRRMRSYRTIQAGRSSIPIKELADANGVSVSTAKRDLEKMIDAGFWGSTAYLDASAGTLCLSYSPNAAQRPAPQPQVMTQPQPQTPAQPAAQPQSKPQAVNEYQSILNDIRKLNESISDPLVSEKISKIEDITGKIFRIVEEKPEKRSEIKSFMSYYLPTTLKLLRAYSTFEKQGIGGENIAAAKNDIERILDTLVTGFTRQLDQLFNTDALDITTDIEVLETMMKKDGLSDTSDDFGGMALGGY